MNKFRQILGGLSLGLGVLLAPLVSSAGVVVLGPASSLPNGTIVVPLVVEGTELFADAITVGGLDFDHSLVTLTGMTPAGSYLDNLIPGGLPDFPLFTFFLATEELPSGPILTWTFTPNGPPIPAAAMLSVRSVLVESDVSEEFAPSTPLNPIPEPGPMVMLLAGLGLLAAFRMTRRLA